MTEFRREALQDFVSTTDGDTPPVYIGRGDILTRIEGYANASWKGRGTPVHGVGKATTIVQGAPGAGKSALMKQLKERSNLIRAHLPDQSRVVLISSEDLLVEMPDVLELIGLAGGLSPDIWKGISSSLALGIDLEAVKAEAALSWAAPDIPRPDSIQTLAKKFPAKGWQGPVIVCIDEAQRLPEDQYSPHARFLKAIHDGLSTLPLSLVLGGLGDTADVAGGMGLTRLSVREIENLSTEPDPERGGYVEVMDLMLSFCDHFGIETNGQESRLTALAAPCEGWPRHLHFALQAMGRSVLKTDGDLAAIDWPEAMRESAESRQGYYHLQQSREMMNASILVARVMAESEDGMHPGEIQGIIEGNVADRPGQRLPKGKDAEDFLNHLIHRGGLHMKPDRTIHCPIPSFRNFLLKAGGLDPVSRPQQERMEMDGDTNMDTGP